MWLRDALPKTLPTVRVYIYGYDTRLIGSTSMQTIFDLGGKFGEVLKQLVRRTKADQGHVLTVGNLGFTVFSETFAPWSQLRRPCS